ncbi:MAG: metallophosphoesterase family protein, partial [Planctomycetota bacterium]
MRILHTADWHLGRRLYGARLTSDQAFALEGLIEITRDTRPDVVLIAGDLYDRAVPPPEAVRLLDEVLTRLTRELGTRVIVIAGNHDSPDRLAFGSEVLAHGGLHVVGTLEGIRPVTVPCADGGPPVLIHPVPFLEPARALIELAELDQQAATEASPENLGAATSHDALYARLLPRVHAARPKKARSVLLGHLFCEGARTLPEGAAERPLAVGGSDRVSPARFAGFDYVALGH